jgi:hypothetical protein
MKQKDKYSEDVESKAKWDAMGLEDQESELRESLSHFKASVDAWSEAMISRPRTAREVIVRRSWRFAAGWTLGCALLAGSISGGVYEQRQKQEQARVAAAREAEHQRQLAAERAREEEDLLAKVDSDISRQVPDAMEPLASLMAEDESK